LAHDVVKSPAKRAQATETNIEANIRNASVCGTQKKHCALNPPALQVAVRGFAKRRAKGSDEMRFRHLRDARESSNAEGLRKCAIHHVPRA
jgi:hypothetical protein